MSEKYYVRVTLHDMDTGEQIGKSGTCQTNGTRNDLLQAAKIALTEVQLPAPKA